MQINQGNLQQLFRGFRTLFLEAFHGAMVRWPDLAMRTTSTHADELYAWLGASPNMKELIGEVVIENMAANNFIIPNKEFESTVAVKEADIERDSYGLYNPMLQAMGMAGKQHGDYLTAQLFLNGFTQKDYTGKNFFDVGKPHENGGYATFTNLIHDVLTANSFALARQMIKSMLNAKGRPMNLGVKLQLIVPPALEVIGRQILQADFIQQTASQAGSVVAAAAVTNVNKGTAELVIWPELAVQPTYWFLVETGYPIKPTIMQIEREITLQALIQPESDHVFKKKEFLYQAYGRYNAGYGLPQLIIGSDGSGAGDSTGALDTNELG